MATFSSGFLSVLSIWVRVCGRSMLLDVDWRGMVFWRHWVGLIMSQGRDMHEAG